LSDVESLTDLTWRIRQAVNAQGFPEVDHVELFGPPQAGGDSRNFVLCPGKAYDRSPCGTGTSARMAQWYTKGKLKKGDRFIHESIIGSKFIGTIEEETKVEDRPAIRPGIEGWAKIYGYNTITIDTEDDPYAYGFQVI
jgi:4-hydroxyproline epimerase